MKASEILSQEHKNILAGLDGLERLMASPLAGQEDTLRRYISFIQEYADAYHHAKEENIYFKWIGEHNPMMLNGPVACMLTEHQHGRNLVGDAAKAVGKLAAGDASAEETIRGSLSGFISMLRAHIMKEDQVLYPMTDNLDGSVGTGDATMLPLFDEVAEKLAGVPEKFADLYS